MQEPPTTTEAVKYIQQECWKLWAGHYDFGLLTDKTRPAYIQLWKDANAWILGEITKEVFDKYLIRFQQVIYRETYRVWKEWSEKVMAKHRKKTIPLIIPTVWITTRELGFINERWANWCYKENEINLDPLFDNKFPPQDYSDIEINLEINSKTYVLNFGKKHKGKTLEQIMRIDPQYLKWLISIDRFEFSEPLKKEMLAAADREAFWD